MKNFTQLRELAGRKARGRKVFSKKIKRISMEIYNDLGKFIAPDLSVNTGVSLP